MAFERPSLKTIYERIITGIESRLTGGVPLLARAVLRVLAKVFAGVIHLAYGFIEYISRQLFVDTAEVDYLSRHGVVWGVSRKASSYAGGHVTFTGTGSPTIPADTRVQNADGVEYATLGDAAISGGSVYVQVQAVEPGAEGNFVGGSVTLVNPISQVNDNATATAMTGGQDRETDDDYRERILQRIRGQGQGGTAADYVRWALEVPGVSGAWCYPLVQGPGTVGMVFKVSGSDPTPTAPLFVDDGSGKDDGTGDVYLYLDARKPITADLLVYPIEKVEIDLAISISPNESAFQDIIESNIEDLFGSVQRPGEDILLSQLRDAIFDSGITDYDITGIDKDSVSQSVSTDVSMDDFEYPILNSITFSTL